MKLRVVCMGKEWMKWKYSSFGLGSGGVQVCIYGQRGWKQKWKRLIVGGVLKAVDSMDMAEVDCWRYVYGERQFVI